MLARTGQAEYADVLERALFNGSLSGVSLDGSLYFYTNPLESRGEHARVPWFRCACCPPNIARLVLSVGDCLLSQSETGDGAPAIWVHIPATLELKTELSGVPTRISMESDYPWSGQFRLRVEPEAPADLELRIRRPGWCEAAEFRYPPSIVHGEPTDGGYEVLRGRFERGTEIEGEWSMAPVAVRANARVLDCLGRAAVQRGPLVYCLEEADFGRPPQLFARDRNGSLRYMWDGSLLGGLGTILAEGRAEVLEPTAPLYGDPRVEPAEARLVPYFAWNNRGAGAMQVWLRES
jgi:hypothetical protein